MKDLVAHTGLSRDTIHYYLGQGLLPPPVAKSRNMAWYGPEHLDRLAAIKRLQEQRFLPLKAIRAILNDSDDQAFSDGQKKLLKGLKSEYSRRFSGYVAPRLRARELPVVERVGRDVVEQLGRRGVIEVVREGGELMISREDADVLEGLAEISAAMQRPEGSWQPEDMEMLNRVAKTLFEAEVAIFADRFNDVGPNDLWDVANAIVPVINRLFGILHEKHIRHFVLGLMSSLDDADDAGDGDDGGNGHRPASPTDTDEIS
jgi:DNA-binding transcriptional MerR regulator